MKHSYLIGAWVAALAISVACLGGTPLPPTPAPQFSAVLDVGVTAPGDGAILGPGPTSVTLLAKSSICCIDHLALIVNGGSASGRAIAGRLEYVSQGFAWTPPAPGEYYLQGRANLSTGASALSPAVRVCVLSVPPFSLYATGYLGPCVIPTRIPSAPAAGTVSISAFVSPQPLTVLPASCNGGAYPQITIVAHVNDPADQVFLVMAALTFDGSELAQVYLNWVTTEPGGLKTFHGVVTPPSPYILTGITSITWGVTAIDRQGHWLTSTGLPNQSLPLLQGDCPHQQAATAAPLQIIPSFTPASAADCPSGTYFAEVTHQCIAISTPTPSSNTSVSCQKITSDTICNSTPGCAFDYGSKTCKKK